METKKVFVVGILLLVLSFSFASAITGSMGNARMILRVDQGDTIEKYILVKNVNNVSLDIELSAEGDLASYVNIKDKSFRLEPGSEKKAYFEITAAESGTTETKINVQFTPTNGENGVGLSSTVIVIAEKSGGFIDGIFGGSDEGSLEEVDATGNVISNGDGKKGGSLTLVLVLVFVLLLLVFVWVLILTKSKKEMRKK